MSHCVSSFDQFLHNPIHPLRDRITDQTESQQPGSDTPEPRQVTLGALPGDPDVHAPHAGHDVHRQHDGTEHRQLAEDVVGLLGTLVHPDVDLGEVVAVGSAQEATEIIGG